MFPENDPETDKRNISILEKGDEFDKSNENSIMKLLWNNLLDTENDPDDNFTEETVDGEITANGITYHFHYFIVFR